MKQMFFPSLTNAAVYVANCNELVKNVFMNKNKSHFPGNHKVSELEVSF